MTKDDLAWAAADLVAAALCVMTAPLALLLWLGSRVREGRG
jgi:hypothetical protein